MSGHPRASAAMTLVKSSQAPIMKLGAPTEPAFRQSNHDSLGEINELQVRKRNTFSDKGTIRHPLQFSRYDRYD
jgi:hypothetical protein